MSLPVLFIDFDDVLWLFERPLKAVFFGIPETLVKLLWGGNKPPVAAQVIGTLLFWGLVVGGIWWMITSAGATDAGS